MILPLHFELPIPPSVNHMYSRSAHGGSYLSKHARQFREDAIAIIWATLAARSIPAPRLSEPLYVEVVIHHKVGRPTGDDDNRVKSLFDALEHAKVVKNDRIIADHRVIRGEPKDAACCRVGIYRIGDAPACLTHPAG